MSGIEQATGTEEAEFDLTQSEVDPNSLEAARKIIARQQTRMRELAQAGNKQKKANQILKDELKHLNDTLGGLVTKLGNKPKSQKEGPREDVTKKELENEMKRSAGLRRQIEVLKAKMGAYDSTRLVELQDEVHEKDKIIADLHANLKLHQRMEKQQLVSDIYRREQQAQAKVHALSEQLIHLKKKLQELKKAQDQQERTYKASVTKLRSFEDKEKEGKNASSPAKHSNEPPKQTYTLLQQQLQRHKELLTASENSRKSLQKSSKAQIQVIRNKLRQIQRANSQLTQQLARKQKEVASLFNKLKNQQKGIDNDTKIDGKSQQGWSTVLVDCRREIKGLSNLRGSIRKFDDSNVLQQGEYRISCLTFKYFQEHILSLKVQYEIGEKSNKKTQVVESFTVGGGQYQNARQIICKLSEYQYVKEWEIFVGRCVQFMRIRTSKEQVLEVGSERSSLKCKRYAFDIKNYEKPVAIFGLLETKSIADKEREVLVSFGLILKRKKVFGKRAKSLARLEGKVEQDRGIEGRGTVMGVRSRNDKNIHE